MIAESTKDAAKTEIVELVITNVKRARGLAFVCLSVLGRRSRVVAPTTFSRGEMSRAGSCLQECKRNNITIIIIITCIEVCTFIIMTPVLSVSLQAVTSYYLFTV